MMTDSLIRELNIRQEVLIRAPVDRVFKGLTVQIGEWWSHSYKDDRKGIYLEPKLGGRFYEDWGDGQGAIYASVSAIESPRMLRLTGPMGMNFPVVGVIEFLLEERGSSTLVKLRHQAVGLIDEEAMQGYQTGWKELLNESFKQHVEGS